MNKFLSLTILCSFALLSSCETENPFQDLELQEPGSNNTGGDTTPDNPGDNSGNISTPDSTLNLTDISFDYTPLSESEVIPSDTTDAAYEDYIENSEFSREVTITYSEAGVSLSGDTSYIKSETEGSHVVITSTKKKLIYHLKGTSTDGSFKIYSENKFELLLDGVTLHSTSRPAINIQSKKRVFVVLADGTTSSLSDGTSYTATTADEDMKACFFSEGQLIFSGKGRLDIEGNARNGLVSDDYIRVRPGAILGVNAKAGHGIKANDDIFINGGVINVSVSAAACKGLKADRLVSVEGGRTTIITTGNGAYDSTNSDTEACAGIKSDSLMQQTGGILYIKSTGTGGKGINTDQGVNIQGGNLVIQTTGRTYSYQRLSSSPKGIRTEGNLCISGGYIHVTCSGGEGSEGLESKNTVIISGGTIEAVCYDDCINASRNITISGGKTYAYSSGNDGIDSNGTLTITGGVTVSSGTTSPEEGFDCDQNTFTITGGILAGSGGGTSTPTSSVTKQGVLLYGASASSGDLIHITNSEGKHLLSYRVPRSYSSMTLLLSAPGMSQGSTYTLSKGGSVTGGESFHDVTWSATSTTSTQKVSDVSFSSIVTTYGNVSSMGGGGMPGGGGPGGWGGRW